MQKCYNLRLCLKFSNKISFTYYIIKLTYYTQSMMKISVSQDISGFRLYENFGEYFDFGGYS